MPRYFDEPIRYIPPKVQKLLDFHNRYNKNEYFFKLESGYADNEEEIFCETFATYLVNGECLHKSNTKIIKQLLERFI